MNLFFVLRLPQMFDNFRLHDKKLSIFLIFIILQRLYKDFTKLRQEEDMLTSRMDTVESDSLGICE